MVTDTTSHAQLNNLAWLLLATLEKRGAFCNLLRTRILF